MGKSIFWCCALLFGSGFLAGTLIPFNVEAPLTASIALYREHTWLLLFVAWLGDWIGASSNYFIGMLASPEWIEKYGHVSKAKIEKAQRFMQGKGIWLASCNFVPGIGNALIIVLGMARSPLVPTILILGVGIFLRLLLVALAAMGIFTAFF